MLINSFSAFFLSFRNLDRLKENLPAPSYEEETNVRKLVFSPVKPAKAEVAAPAPAHAPLIAAPASAPSAAPRALLPNPVPSAAPAPVPSAAPSQVVAFAKPQPAVGMSVMFLP